jgi:hypothetical protein
VVPVALSNFSDKVQDCDQESCSPSTQTAQDSSAWLFGLCPMCCDFHEAVSTCVQLLFALCRMNIYDQRGFRVASYDLLRTAHPLWTRTHVCSALMVCWVSIGYASCSHFKLELDTLHAEFLTGTLGGRIRSHLTRTAHAPISPCPLTLAGYANRHHRLGIQPELALKIGAKWGRCLRNMHVSR